MEQSDKKRSLIKSQIQIKGNFKVYCFVDVGDVH